MRALRNGDGEARVRQPDTGECDRIDSGTRAALDPDVGAFGPSLLDHIVQRCLAKDPDERWQTAADLKLDLAWLQRHEADDPAAPAGSRLVPAGEQLVSVSSRWTRLGVVVGAFLLMAAGTAWQLRPFNGGRDAIRTIAVVPFRNLGTDPNAAYLSDTLTS